MSGFFYWLSEGLRTVGRILTWAGSGQAARESDHRRSRMLRIAEQVSKLEVRVDQLIDEVREVGIAAFPASRKNELRTLSVKLASLRGH